MTDTNDKASPAQASSEPTKAVDSGGQPMREYDRTGLYPKEGKAFRLWAILGWNLLVVAILAVVSAALNFILL